MANIRVGWKIFLVIAVMGMGGVSRSEDATESSTWIGKITSVGREGKGNPEAAAAWKKLVQQGPEVLPLILRAMKDDDRIGSNWLRPAFEAVASRALAEGKLSAEPLESFVKDRKQSGAARRLAFEWLTQVDKTAPDRWLPQMLDDPSAELRRDAIDRLIKEGEKLAEKKDNDAAKSVFEKALKTVGDPEQIDVLAKALEKLGVKIDLPKTYGFIQQWHLITPFDHRKGKGWNVAHPPEKGVDLAATYPGTDGKEAKWVPHSTTDATGVVNLNKVLGNLKGTIAYACAQLDSPDERLVEFRAGCINGLKIFLNGKEIFAREEYHHGMRVDQYSARGVLQKGTNTILLKVAQNEQKEPWAQNWQFQLRVCDTVGAAVPFTQKTTTKAEGK